MQHLLINPYSQSQEWCKEYFPDRSLGMMPVAGRCAAEYFIDLALRCEDIMRDTRGLSRFCLKVKKAVCLLIKTDLC